MDSTLADWRDIGARPIDGGSPAGVSARYDPDYEALDAQIQKLEGLTRQPVDWADVVTLGRRILERKSKDLLVGSYVAMGLLQTEGCAGLAKGLACLEGMVAGFWPDLFPELKRLKARVNALNWLAERAGSALAQGALRSGDAEAAAACESQAGALSALLQEKIPGEGPDWSGLLRPLRELAAEIPPKPAPTVPDARPPRAEAAPAPAAQTWASPATASIDTAEDARRFLQDSLEPLRRAAAVLRAGDPATPAPYSLVRALTWADIDALPPASAGETRVPPPPAHVRDRFRALVAEGAWKDLLEEAEERVAEFPFWLDLHRLSDQALGQLGPDCACARRAVRAETASLLTRLAGLDELRFSDGSPFADEATRRWIGAELFPAPAEASAAGDRTEQPDWLAGLRERSRAAVADGKPAEALALVQDAARTASAGRDRFLARIELARLCLDMGQLRPALAWCELLDEQVRRHALEEWDPPLSVDALRLYEGALDQAAQASGPSAPEIAGKADAVYNRLCRLDVLAGVHLVKATRR